MELEHSHPHHPENSPHEYPTATEKEALKVAHEALQYKLFNQAQVPFPEPHQPKFTFIDLFAGIGGFRVAMQSLGGKCVFTSEWDEKSQLTYKVNFGR